MRNLISFILVFLLPVSAPAPIEADSQPLVQAKSAVLMSEYGDVLYNLDAERMLPMASTTKLMTALLTVERCDLDETVEILPAYCGVEGSSMYLKVGESCTVRDLLTGLLLVSGNDAAYALACHMAGDIDAFSELMNRRAKELGMQNSHFTNPHGLNDAAHYSTAYDLALLMRAVMQNDCLASILCMPNAELDGQTLVNHNKLLALYPDCIGGKTGFTKVAGRCLVSCAERAGSRFFCVTLHDPDDWDDHAALYDWAFSHFETKVFNAENCTFSIPLLSGKGDYASAVPAEERKLLLSRGAEAEIKLELPYYVFAPVSHGAPAGRMLIYLDGQLVEELPLVYNDNYPIR